MRLLILLLALGACTSPASAQEDSAPATDPTRWRIKLGQHLPALQSAEAAVSDLAPIIDKGTRELEFAAKSYAEAPTDENLTRWFAAASAAISNISKSVEAARAERPTWTKLSEGARAQLLADIDQGRAAMRERERRMADLRERALAAERTADDLRRPARQLRDAGRERTADVVTQARQAHRAVAEAQNALLLEEGRLANQNLNVEAMAKASAMLDAAEEELWSMYTDLDLFGGELGIAAERLSILMDMQETREAWSILARLGSRVRQIGIERKGFAVAIDALAREAGRESRKDFETPIEVRSDFEAWLYDAPLYGETKSDEPRASSRSDNPGPDQASESSKVGGR